jgi:pimeloyl-ACP methyl ester carboxylesterase
MLVDYLKGGLVATGNGSEMRLACAREWEAANFRNAPDGISSIASGVKCPLTVLHAQNGTASGGEVAVVARLAPQARIVPVPDTTHFLPMERPDLVREEILRFA